jgi:hypothetical protein
VLFSPLSNQESLAAAQPQAKNPCPFPSRSIDAGRWSWGHNKVLELPDLSRRAKGVYRALAHFANNTTQTTFASIRRLGEIASYKRRSVTYGLRELEALQLVETTFRGAPGKRQTSLYRLVCPNCALTALENAAVEEALEAQRLANGEPEAREFVPSAEDMDNAAAPQSEPFPYPVPLSLPALDVPVCEISVAADALESDCPAPDTFSDANLESFNCVASQEKPCVENTISKGSDKEHPCKGCASDGATPILLNKTPNQEPPTPTASRQGNGQSQKPTLAKNAVMEALNSLFAVWVALGLDLARPSQDPYCNRAKRAIARALKAGATVEQIAAAMEEYGAQFTNCSTGLRYCKKFANFLAHRTWEGIIQKTLQKQEAARAQEQLRASEPEEVTNLKRELAERMGLDINDKLFDNSIELRGYRLNVPIIKVAPNLRDRMFYHVSNIFGGWPQRLKILWEDGYLRSYAWKFRPEPDIIKKRRALSEALESP